MSVLHLYSKRVILLLVLASVVIWISPLFGTTLGKWGYLILYPTVLVILVALTMRQKWKDFPTGASASSERTALVSMPFSQTCEMVPGVIKSCGWKLMQADGSQNHFKAKIGMSRKTWGQVIDINLIERNDEGTTVAVRIVADHILWDFGQNNKMINKFLNGLEDSLPRTAN